MLHTRPGPTPHVSPAPESDAARSRRYLRTFLSYYRPYRRLLLADLACAFVVAGIAVVVPLLVRYITGELLAAAPPTLPGPIVAVGAAMLGLLVVQVACDTFVDVQGHMMGTLIERDMRRDLFDHYQRLPRRFHDTQRTGQLLSRLTGDLEAISELAHHGPEDVLIAVIKFVGTFAVLLQVTPGLTGVIFALLPVMLVYALRFHRRLSAAYLRGRERMGDVNAQVEDSLAGIRVVQSFAGETAEARKFALENARFVQTRRDVFRNEAWFHQGVQTFTGLLTILVVVLGGVLIARRDLALADLLTALLLVGVLVDPVQRFVNFARVAQEGLPGFTRFMQIMDLQPEIADAPHATPLTGVRGRIEFRDVSFAYAEDGEHVLRGLNLRVQPGETVALVGPSGAGKSTLCALIPRFYEVTAGSILIDGHDVRDVTLASLRRQIGVVPQDVYLFAGSVADNIRYGRPDATDAEVEAAARRAHAHDFIRALPLGYDTEVGQRGVMLSGGQRQRLSLARAFLTDPPILLLDEATSALDTGSERAVQAALETLRGHRTQLVIAHRLSTVRTADRIVVLTEDGIVEDGTHAQLLARGGAYAQLYDSGQAV
ncbi:ATP-binding cassette subfamily B protein [Deinococcus metalli]|uniref:ABC transporter ATP-binding protein n=1 Tax=Deinococcus metalli TaxID=1141878 RepID=A0A7W8NSF2_9DEIO|nr:ABC transporter ATP-binding protein [Deinococcus metalli]MBB5377913.1 ATP-binding cassette subfamily B protein [Deinococcus metalli]GHF55145.1 ABC transporter ATP-binding protein [Deinococcus metalli]